MTYTRRTLRELLAASPLGSALRPAWFDEARLLIQGPELERLTERVPLRGRVLNAGSGEGLYSAFLERFGSVTEIVNMDLGDPGIARTRRDPRHRDWTGSLTGLPFANAEFDACLCSEVLEHIPDDRRALTELARCLKPGATLLLSVPTPPAPLDPNHVREGYRLQDLDALLHEAGFAIEAHAYCLHAVSRLLYVVWEAQSRRTGRNWFPRALLRALAHLDRRLRLGQPWDLVVLARRRSENGSMTADVR